MDLDLLQRLVVSRLPIYLDRPDDVAAFMLLRDRELVTGSVVSESGCTPRVSVTSVTLDGRALLALHEVGKTKLASHSWSSGDCP